MKKQLSFTLALLLSVFINFTSHAQLGSNNCNVTASNVYVIQGLNNSLLFGSSPILGANMELGVSTFVVTFKNGQTAYLSGTPSSTSGYVEAGYTVSCSNPVSSVVFIVNAKNKNTGVTCSDSYNEYFGGVCGTTNGVGKFFGPKAPKPPGSGPSTPEGPEPGGDAGYGGSGDD